MAQVTTKQKLKELLGNEFICKNQDGKHIKVAFDDRLNDVKAVAIYFSAHWCGPCQRFTPNLVKASREWRKEGCEVIYVSSDGSAKEFEEYFGTMGDWMAYPIGNAQIKKLQSHFDVQGIPSLFVIDQNGDIIDDSGRGTVQQKGTDAVAEWTDIPKGEILNLDLSKTYAMRDSDSKYLSYCASDGWCRQIYDNLSDGKWEIEATDDADKYYIINRLDDERKNHYLSYGDKMAVGLYAKKSDAAKWQFVKCENNAYKLKCIYNGVQKGWLACEKNEKRWNYLYQNESEADVYFIVEHD